MIALACILAGTAYAPGTPIPHPDEPTPQPGPEQGFAGTDSTTAKAVEGCWFSAHKPFVLHTRDRYVHGQAQITRCTAPAPVYCHLQSRLQMWVPYSSQWVQKGEWADSGWKTCRPGIALNPSYRCPTHSTQHEFITDTWLTIVTHQAGSASNYVNSPREKFTCS
ncbi:hypothetical protein NE236_25085 [Actinoallomurus purpureus]|uniref:hypothetical protein n=1 Tax=Actinoallomurus purpureus TaxID=478114 RepID=UPI002093B2D0|nr:hypothetical protein [Actinoallomurus purpureus]MCO6008257.1 hypothetical protein [Actinoallomurus purpureus]